MKSSPIKTLRWARSGPNRKSTGPGGLRWTRRTVVSIVAISVALLALGTAAAGSLVGTNGVITGCVDNSNGTLHVVAPGSSCNSSQHALSWRQNGIQWMGAWQASSTYGPNDVVTYKGSSWLALQTSTNQTPTSSGSSWRLLIAQGSAGPRGLTGQQGPQGQPGPPGLVSAQSGWNNGPIDIPNSGNNWIPMIAMTVPKPGFYIIFARTMLSDSNNDGPADCQLVAGSDVDESNVDIQNNPDSVPVALNLLHEFTGSNGRILIQCRAYMQGASLDNIKITAINAGLGIYDSI